MLYSTRCLFISVLITWTALEQGGKKKPEPVRDDEGPEENVPLMDRGAEEQERGGEDQPPSMDDMLDLEEDSDRESDRAAAASNFKENSV